jgi:hypothetical protein
MSGTTKSRRSFRSNPRQELSGILDAAGDPQTVAQLTGLLGIPAPFVAYMLTDAVKSGRVTKLADRRYVGAARPRQASDIGQLSELFQFVSDCEAEWRRDYRLGLL